MVQNFLLLNLTSVDLILGMQWLVIFLVNVKLHSLQGKPTESKYSIIWAR